MKGLSAVGIVCAAEVTLLTNDSKTFPLGNILCNTIVAAITAGIARIYPLTPVERNRMIAK
jgi:hypothetical protein